MVESILCAREIDVIFGGIEFGGVQRCDGRMLPDPTSKTYRCEECHVQVTFDLVREMFPELLNA